MAEAPILRALAFVHPAWMITVLALALLTARLGLDVRRRRRRGLPIGRALRQRHMRLGRWTLIGVGVGFVLGPLSMVGLRGAAAFDSFHGILGIVVAGLFGWTGWTGRALARGDAAARAVHRLAAAGAIGAAGLAAVAGFRLLP